MESIAFLNSTIQNIDSSATGLLGDVIDMVIQPSGGSLAWRLD